MTNADRAFSREAVDSLVESMAGSSNTIRDARVIRIDGVTVWLDIGAKFETSLPLSEWNEESAPGVGEKTLIYVDDDISVDSRPLRVSRAFIHIDRPGPAREFWAKVNEGRVNEGDLRPGQRRWPKA